MSISTKLKTAALVLVLVVAAVVLFVVVNALFVAASVLWGLLIVAFLVLVVPLCIAWTLFGLLSFRTKGWRHALGETLLRLAVSVFAAAMVGDIFGILATDEIHGIVLAVLVLFLIPGVIVRIWGQMRHRLFSNSRRDSHNTKTESQSTTGDGSS